MEGFTLGLALVDAIPVLSFGISMVIIAGRFDSPLFMIGAAFSVLAGCCKVAWKMILGITKKDLRWLNKPFVPVRKAGKLPCATISKTYALEYGTATIEMHKDAIKPGQKVVLVDDLIATGGTIRAAADLVEELGGEVVKILFLLELKGLNGREVLKDYDVASVVAYDGK